MILSSNLRKIGRVNKTHGIDGELSMEILPDINPEALKCVVFDIDGINVPFFITGVRARRTSACIVSLEGIKSDSEASMLVGDDVYGLVDDPAVVQAFNYHEQTEEEFLALEDLMGYRIEDTDGTVIGVIEDIDDSTDNVLFNVERPDMTLVHIPAAEPLIEGVDIENKVLTMNLPEGLY